MSSYMQKWPYFIRLAVIKGPCALIFWNLVLRFWMWKRQRCRRCGEGEEVLLYNYGGEQWSIQSSIGCWSLQHSFHRCHKLKLEQPRYESDVALRTTVLKAVIHQLQHVGSTSTLLFKIMEISISTGNWGVSWVIVGIVVGVLTMLAYVNSVSPSCVYFITISRLRKQTSAESEHKNQNQKTTVKS